MFATKRGGVTTIFLGVWNQTALRYLYSLSCCECGKNWTKMTAFAM